MKTVKIKFAGKWEGITPEENVVCYWLQKNGYDVQVTDDADYIICESTYGNRLHETKEKEERLRRQGQRQRYDK